MAYVRISYMRPRRGQETRLAELMDKISGFYAAQPGYIVGYRLQPHEGDTTRRMGRIGVWESEEHAVEAAQNDHALALRSEILLVTDEDSHEELSFIGAADR